MSKQCIILKIGVVSKEVKAVPVLVILGKYTITAIKLVSTLFQNVSEKILGCTDLYRQVLAFRWVQLKKKLKKNIKKHFI